MFTQKCFIRKNTKEITSIIENIGYRLLFTSRRNEGKFLVCANKFCFGQDDKIPDNYIDCGDNKELFFAVASLRDDSDNFQLFFNNEDFDCRYPIECIHDKFYMFAIDPDTCEFIDNTNEYHKGTPQELLKHFKAE